MKKISSVLYLLFAFTVSFGQLKQPQTIGGKNTRVIARDQLGADSLFLLPNRDTNFIPERPGSMIYRGVDKTPYIWNGTNWEATKGSGPGGTDIIATAPLDKTGSSLTFKYNNEGLKLNDNNSLEAKAKVFGSFNHLRGVPVADTNSTYAVYANKNFHYFKYDPNDVMSADDSAMVLVSSGGQRFKRVIADVIYPEDFGAIGDGVTNDAPAFNKMFRWIEKSMGNIKRISHKNILYLTNDTLFLPKGLASSNSETFIHLVGHGVEYKKTTPGPLLYRMPSSQSEATGTMIGDYIMKISGLKFTGNSIVSQVAIKVGATYNWEIVDNRITNFDTAIVAPFMLNGLIARNRFTNNLSAPIKGVSGEDLDGNKYWEGATISNSSFNSNVITGNRIFNRVNSLAGVMIIAGDGNTIEKHISEGRKPAYDIYINSLNSSVSKGNKIQTVWFETSAQAGDTRQKNIAIYNRGTGTQLYVSDFELIYADTLFSIDGAASGSLHVSAIKYLHPSAMVLKTSGLSTSNYFITLRDINHIIKDYFFDTAKWDGGVITSRLVAFGAVSSTQDGLWANGAIGIYPHQNPAIAQINRKIDVGGNIAWTGLDNQNYIGRYGSTNARPKGIWVGTDGIKVDPTAPYGYGFGTSATPTQYWRSFNDSTTRIFSTGSITVPLGNTAQRPGNLGSNNIANFRFNTDNNKFEGRWSVTASDWRNFASENFVQDSSLSLRTSIQKNLDSLFQHNLRIIKNSDSLAAHNARLIALRDSISNLRNSINSLPTGSSGTSSETLVTPNDADYTITTGTGNLTIVYFNTLTAERLVTQPDPATNTNRIFTLKHGGGGLFNLNLSVPIHENSTTTTSSIAPGVSIQYMSDGTKFIKIR